MAENLNACAAAIALVNAYPELWPDLNRMTLHCGSDWQAGGTNWPWVLRVLERRLLVPVGAEAGYGRGDDAEAEAGRYQPPGDDQGEHIGAQS